jgi:inosine-uridine nucleoside N-ribohydrolase
VQLPAASALANISAMKENKLMLVELNALPQIAELLKSKHGEIVLHAVGSITNLASDPLIRLELLTPDFIDSLASLASSRSTDPRIVKNCVGALLNLTHSTVPMYS